jgi:flagellin
MVVQHNMQAANTNRQLSITNGDQAKNTEKLSSGYRINRAGDDAAGLSISEKMRSQIRGLDKASTNAQDGISLIQTAEGALNETHAILQRMNELATQAANDTNTTADRNAIQAELNNLTSEIDRIQSTTAFNTMNLLDGTFTNKNLQVGSLSGQKISISIKNMNAKTIFNASQATGAVTNTYTTSVALGAACSKLSVKSFSLAGTAMKTIQDAINTVSMQRSNLGAIQNRLEHTIKNLDTSSENTQAAESRIRDTDMAKTMVEYSKNNILAQAGQSMLAQANQANQGVLSLLG